MATWRRTGPHKITDDGPELVGIKDGEGGYDDLRVAVPLRGTLVVASACDAGYVVAADSRTTIGDTYCDGRQKLHPVTGKRALLTLTGSSTFLKRPAEWPDDPCTLLTSAAPTYDGSELILEVLRSSSRQLLTAPDLQSAVELAARRLIDIDEARPDWLADFVGRDLFQAVLFTSSTEALASHASKILLSPNGEIQMTNVETTEVRLTDDGGVSYWGETAYLERMVRVGGPAHHLLNGAMLSSFMRRVSDTTTEQALAACEDALQAAERAGDIERPATGIGGPIAAYLLSSDEDPVELRSLPIAEL